VPDEDRPIDAGDSAGPRPSLRAEQVRQTRIALVRTGRTLFGQRGFAATSVDDIAREAGVTSGALYHHFPTKSALFETVFEELHAELLEASALAATRGHGHVDRLALAFDAFLDAVLDPDVQRIIVVDAPAVLGLARFTELDERYAFGAIVDALERASADGALRVTDPETLARLLLGALTRGGLLIASAPDPRRTRDGVARTMRDLLAGLEPLAPERHTAGGESL